MCQALKKGVALESISLRDTVCLCQDTDHLYHEVLRLPEKPLLFEGMLNERVQLLC